LGLTPLLDEVRAIVSGFTLAVREKRNANSGAVVRELLDARFENAEGWTTIKSGGIDWTKCHKVNGTRVCVGVEIQTSGRSDLIIVDMIHLRREFVAGRIDVGVLVVPSKELSYFLTDRAPSIADAKRIAAEARTEDLPLLFLAFSHDEAGDVLPKRPKKPNSF
jgi:hypothetical protein